MKTALFYDILILKGGGTMENTAEKLNLIIDYIERHLTEKIEQNVIEKIACCSYYDVGRMFNLIAGVNISDYVRKRRLTLAGIELKYEESKVIDVATKYGYDSPVSFARAFKTFHGFNPSLTNKEESIINLYPRLIYQINAKGVIDIINKDKITINGKDYEASYFGEIDMSLWSYEFSKRKYWRLENAYDDLKNMPKLEQVLPYNNYPPINIKTGQAFAIDYYKSNGQVERKFYLSDGSMWENMPCTREISVNYTETIRIDKIYVGGTEYEASYFGEQDMSEWSEYATKREFWRLENTDCTHIKYKKLLDVLPYTNYPPIKIEVGQIFAIDYYTRKGSIDRRYYIADGTVWQNMQSTRQILIEE